MLTKSTTILTSTQPVLDTSGWRTVLAGSHTAVENEKHSKDCQSIGGIDITNDSDIKVAQDTADIEFCKIVDKAKYNLSKYDVAGIDGVDSTSIQGSYNEYGVNPIGLLGGSVTAYAPNATIPFNVKWWIQGAGDFSDLLHNNVYVSVSVPDLSCGGTNPVKNFTGGGTITVKAWCNPSMTRASAPDYVSACIQGSSLVCSNATGLIRFD